MNQREREREREKDLASFTDLHCSELEIFLGFKRSGKDRCKRRRKV